MDHRLSKPVWIVCSYFQFAVEINFSQSQFRLRPTSGLEFRITAMYASGAELIWRSELWMGYVNILICIDEEWHIHQLYGC